MRRNGADEDARHDPRVSTEAGKLFVARFAGLLGLFFPVRTSALPVCGFAGDGRCGSRAAVVHGRVLSGFVGRCGCFS